MHNNLNQQILRGAADISVNTCVFSDAYIFFRQTLSACLFFCHDVLN